MTSVTSGQYYVAVTRMNDAPILAEIIKEYRSLSREDANDIIEHLTD